MRENADQNNSKYRHFSRSIDDLNYMQIGIFMLECKTVLVWQNNTTSISSSMLSLEDVGSRVSGASSE